MDAGQALRDVHGYAKANRITYTGHALKQMHARRIMKRDIENALMNATVCKWQSDKENWKVTGKDLDGVDLRVVVAIEDGIVVVSTF